MQFISRVLTLAFGAIGSIFSELHKHQISGRKYSNTDDCCHDCVCGKLGFVQTGPGARID